MGNAVTYGQILWDNFLQYVSKNTPKEEMIELTFARFGRCASSIFTRMLS